jgi:hypothetical protein
MHRNDFLKFLSFTFFHELQIEYSLSIQRSLDHKIN